MSELEELKTLGTQALNVMSDLLNPAPEGKENRDLLKECLGFSASQLSSVEPCTEAETAGDGLVCPLPQVRTTPNAACNFNTYVRRSATLSYLVEQVIDYDDTFVYNFKVADTRTTIGHHAHTFSGQQTSCAHRYVKRQDFFQLYVAIFQGSSGDITLPNDPTDNTALGAAGVRAESKSGMVLNGPKVALCLKETHDPPRRCNENMEEPETPEIPEALEIPETPETPETP